MSSERANPTEETRCQPASEEYARDTETLLPTSSLLCVTKETRCQPASDEYARDTETLLPTSSLLCVTSK
ncbi:hypothetical protein J6590_010133 [Homalodisca vitripennis]|nr:hypothetical protein J6590_010133 [Homalodisca vitripennis]